MKRNALLALKCVTAICSAELGAEIFVNQPYQMQLDDVFRGPVATLHFRLPVQNGFRQLRIDDSGNTYEIMTFRLQSGGSYNNFYDVTPDQFIWQEFAIDFQLLPAIAPLTVSNFASYVSSGAYTDSIIHRSEIFVLQGGGWMHEVKDGYPLQKIPTAAPIPLDFRRGFSNIPVLHQPEG